MNNWSEQSSRIRQLLDDLSFRDPAGADLEVDAGFVEWTRLASSLREARGTIYLIGNGASASMASHFAADLVKNAHVHAQVITDVSLMTAVSNDISFEQVFAEPLRHCGREGDMLVAISSSGRSPNILRAVEAARLSDISIVTLSAMDSDNPLCAAGDLNGYIPAGDYGLAETCHAAVLHHWMDMMEIRK